MTTVHTRSAYVIITVAWLLFMLSFLLPATDVIERGGTAPGTPLTGWQAFIASIRIGLFNPLVWVAEPRFLLFLVFPFANGLMLLVPLLCLVLRDKAAFLALPLLPCGVIPWILPKSLVGNLFIGFYLWNLSFLAMCVGCVVVSLAYREKY